MTNFRLFAWLQELVYYIYLVLRVSTWIITKCSTYPCTVSNLPFTKGKLDTFEKKCWCYTFSRRILLVEEYGITEKFCYKYIISIYDTIEFNRFQILTYIYIESVALSRKKCPTYPALPYYPTFWAIFCEKLKKWHKMWGNLTISGILSSYDASGP